MKSGLEATCFHQGCHFILVRLDLKYRCIKYAYQWNLCRIAHSVLFIVCAAEKTPMGDNVFLLSSIHFGAVTQTKEGRTPPPPTQ